MEQLSIISSYNRPKAPILKWIGNKFKYANKIVRYFPESYNKYIEPFVGTGAILGTVSPENGIAGDTLKPLIDFWRILQKNPQDLIEYYSDMIIKYNCNRHEIYNVIKNRYNNSPNAFDLLIISRTCYGGVMRFTREGAISTPIGPHKPISPKNFALRVKAWHERIKNTRFFNKSFELTMSEAEKNDLIYCDPPYLDSQSILYGAQDFRFEKLIEMIDDCKKKGAKIALSIDGKKKSGKKEIKLVIPKKLFEREIFLDCGSSMLKRFQNGGKIMIGEDVHDRLLLTW